MMPIVLSSEQAMALAKFLSEAAIESGAIGTR
jgi:hypothetical protein